MRLYNFSSNLRYLCKYICLFARKSVYLRPKSYKYALMREKSSRLEALRELIAGRELASQEEVLKALKPLGYKLTQATLSRDLRQLKVVKQHVGKGKYRYVLPPETNYRRVSSIEHGGLLQAPGFRSIHFSGNMIVVKTRPGHASSIAYNIDNADVPQILGTIAGDDTIFMVKKDGVTEEEVINGLNKVMPIAR